ncbi:hypothetical protein [Rhodohalobacter mucosus]|uniref:Uncharacterized protein n=1 Tax=Rhodohalobacter mucosus TaxID=2079485 RepID=A0A316TTT3_9BACT|nr:hypothetical protein [Rhodohalobacter mucosus]PWN06729.1 hypothetical protein DDZ15_09445 [Rhodohalobacter mucosus]
MFSSNGPPRLDLFKTQIQFEEVAGTILSREDLDGNNGMVFQKPLDSNPDVGHNPASGLGYRKSSLPRADARGI